MDSRKTVDDRFVRLWARRGEGEPEAG